MTSLPGLLPLYWDQTELDRQYNARATVPDVLPIMAEYRTRTLAVQAACACHLAIPFGPSEPERLDVYPAGPGAPVFVFIHGGYWRALDAADSGFTAAAMAQAGICTVAVNYTLSPLASLDEIVRQCRAALDWVHGHIAEYGGDPARIHVGGSSAGAHLAAMLAAAPERRVQGLTLLSGLFDLTRIPDTHVNAWLQLDAAAAERNSPLWQLPPAGTRIVGSYAPNETDEFKRQSEVYFAACHAAGCDVTVVAVPGTSHFDLPFALADAASPLSQAVHRAMGVAHGGS